MSRIEEISKLNYCEYYKEFLRQNPEQPLPNTLYFKWHLDYMFWIDKKHIQYRNLINIPKDASFCNEGRIEYNNKFLKWLKNG